jgi:hypothetical protein
MPTRKSQTLSNTITIPVIRDEAFGEFAVNDYNDRLYAKIYYAIRDRQGFLARNAIGEKFTWNDFKVKFAEVFGTPENRQFTLEQMLDYAMKKFGMSQDDLIEANNRSWQRRREWQAQEARSMEEAEMMAEIPY